jgi:CRISPR/Cas system-associated exonuclease Cas4 (RecB family)
MTTPIPKKYWDELEELVDKELEVNAAKRIARRKKRGWFSISNAGWCMRAAILNRLNAKETQKDDKARRIFFIGDLIHEGYRQLIEKAGRLVASEQFVSTGYGPEASDRVGVFDVIVKTKYTKKNILYEMKSIGAGGFWKMVLKTKAPSKHHVYQAVTYYLENEKTKKYQIDEVKIVYFSKQDGAIRAWKVALTPDLLQEVENWWNLLREFYANRRMPDPFEVDSDEYKHYYCSNCSFKEHYCFPPEGQEAVVAQNLLDLDWDDPQPKVSDGNTQTQEGTDVVSAGQEGQSHEVPAEEHLLNPEASGQAGSV